MQALPDFGVVPVADMLPPPACDDVEGEDQQNASEVEENNAAPPPPLMTAFLNIVVGGRSILASKGRFLNQMDEAFNFSEVSIVWHLRTLSKKLHLSFTLRKRWTLNCTERIP